MHKDSSASPEVIRLTMRWVVTALLFVLVVGGIGGVIGSSIIRPPLPALTEDQAPLVANVQEVTISPSKAAAQLVTDSERAILLLTDGSSTAIGLVATNDGLVVSVSDLTSSQLYAFDSTGTRLPLSKVGRDELFGMTYYRLSNAVIAPLAMTGQDPAVGASMLALRRSATTFGSAAQTTQLITYDLPPALSPAAWQKIGRISNLDPGFNGAPLITDSGELAGLIYSDGQRILPVSLIRSSLNRVTTNQRETNPFTTLGLRLDYRFVLNENTNKQEFQVSVVGVTPGSPASAAGLVAGDIVRAVKQTRLEWGSELVGLLSDKQDLTVTVERNDTETVLSIHPERTQS